MPVHPTRDFHAWKVQSCQLVTHETTGLRFFVFDNEESQQTDVAVVSEFANAGVVELEAKEAGHSAEAYTDFLADQALEAATRHLERTGKRH